MKETIDTSKRMVLEETMKNVSKEIFQLRSALSGYLVEKYHFEKETIISFDKNISKEERHIILSIKNAIDSLKTFEVKFILEDIIEFDIPLKWNQTTAIDGIIYQLNISDVPRISEVISLLDNLRESILNTFWLIHPQVVCTDVEYLFDSTLDAIIRLQEALAL